MRARIMRIKAELALTIILLVLFLTSCIYVDEGRSEDFDCIFYLINSGPEDDFFKILKQGAEDAASEMNIKLETRALRIANNAVAQLEYINEAENAGARGITISPVNDPKVEEKLKDLRLHGVVINSFDRRVDKEICDITVGTDSYESGEIAARRGIEAIGGSGEILVVTNGVSRRSVDRANGFTSYLEALPIDKKTSLSISDTVTDDATKDDAKNKVKESLKGHPDVKLIFATGSAELCGAYEAVSELKLDGIELIGFDVTDQTKELLQNKSIYGLLIPVPYNVGYLSIRYLKKLALNEAVDDTINSGVRFIKAEDAYAEDSKVLLSASLNEEVKP